jgi:hypothetical protein
LDPRDRGLSRRPINCWYPWASHLEVWSLTWRCSY